MIQVSIRDLINSVQPMRKIAETTMDGVSAIRFARLIREIDKEAKLFEETRMGLLQKYGEVIDENQIRISNENKAQFEQELQQALNEMIEINAEPLPIGMFEVMSLTPKDVSALVPFIK